jgi:hypothetical protein
MKTSIIILSSCFTWGKWKWEFVSITGIGQKGAIAAFGLAEKLGKNNKNFSCP